MIWTYTETHTRTLRHRHAHTHTYCLHTDMHTIVAARSSRVLRVYSMLPIHTQPFTHLYKHTVQIDVRTNAHTLPLDLSLSHSHTHTRTVIHYYMSILWTSLHWTSPYTFSSSHFGRQTMRNDSKWKCSTCSPIRPLSSKPNICVFLSVCTQLVVRSAEKKAPAYENVWEWLKAPSLVCKATVTNRRRFYCIYMI